jgi:hypothetical protein
MYPIYLCKLQSQTTNVFINQCHNNETFNPGRCKKAGESFLAKIAALTARKNISLETQLGVFLIYKSGPVDTNL